MDKDIGKEKMGSNTKETGKKASLMDLDHINMEMVGNFKDNGLMVLNMEKEFNIIQIKMFLLDILDLESLMDMGD